MRPSRLRVPRILALGLLASAIAGVGPVAAADPVGAMVPIGSDYQADTLELFAREAATRPDDDTTVRILVLPITYSLSGLSSTKSERKKNLSFAENRRSQVEAACNAVKAGDETCIVELVPALERADATDSAVLAFFDAEVDGMYVLGGDQTVALQVVQDTPLEARMAAAFRAGAAFGGNSAGDAVQSRAMINGYTGSNGPAESLLEGAVDVRDGSEPWDGNTASLPTRGLDFGFRNLITDQHVFEYGRMGRSLNVALTEDLPVLGMDAATGAVVRDHTRLADVTGDTAGYVVDPDAWDATHAFAGPDGTLSGRDVAFHLLPPGMEFDFATMLPNAAGGVAIPRPDIGARTLAGVSTATAAPLYLAGGIGDEPAGAVGQAFVDEAGGTEARLVVLAAGYAKSGDASKAAKAIASALAPSVASAPAFTTASKPADVGAALATATAVIVTGHDRTLVEAQLAAWPAWSTAVARWQGGMPLLADDAVAAVMGVTYAAEAPAADVEAAAIEDAIETTTDAGFGLVQGISVATRLLPDQHWPQLIALARTSVRTAVGIDVGTAVRIAGAASPMVLGDSAAVLLDGRQATIVTGTNGAQGAAWLILDSYVDGEAIAP